MTSRIEATAQLNTVLVTAEVRDTDRDRSLAIAEGISNTFGTMVDELDNKGRRSDVVIITAVSGPTLDLRPVAPNWLLYTGLGLLAGLGLGSLIAIGRDALDNTVRSNLIASSLVEAPVLGVIDYDADSAKSPLLLGEAANSVRAESFRQLRTNLQFVDAAKSAEVLLVTSAVPGEGKSLTSVNLAISFAEFGQKVLLIDADLRRPVLWNYFGVEKDVGLSSVLAGNTKLEDAIQPWGSDGLHVLASGQLPPNPAELLGSKAMSDLVSKVRTDFDKVILDTPPLLPVTDAALASAAVDGVVLVVRWGRTHRSQVTAAVETLRQVNARVLGSVLNMRRLSRGERQSYAAQSYYGASSATKGSVPTARPALAPSAVPTAPLVSTAPVSSAAPGKSSASAESSAPVESTAPIAPDKPNHRSGRRHRSRRTSRTHRSGRRHRPAPPRPDRPRQRSGGSAACRVRAGRAEPAAQGPAVGRAHVRSAPARSARHHRVRLSSTARAPPSPPWPTAGRSGRPLRDPARPPAAAGPGRWSGRGRPPGADQR